LLWHYLKASVEKDAALQMATANLAIARSRLQEQIEFFPQTLNLLGTKVYKQTRKQTSSRTIAAKVAVKSQSVPKLKEAEVDDTNPFP
jgi:hypothetical protein